MIEPGTPLPTTGRRATRVAVFLAGVLLCTTAATVRFGDSAHAMGTVALDGGHVRHPAVLSARHRRHTVVVTATVRPPLAGALRVRVEGAPGLTAEIAHPGPAACLGLHRRPRLVGDTLVDVRAGDRLALWVVLRHDPTPAGTGPPPARIVFSSAASGYPVLTVPVVFHTRGGT